MVEQGSGGTLSPRDVLAWQAPPHIPDSITVTAKTFWLAYTHRWPVEPGIRFRKQHLGWTTPCPGRSRSSN